MRPARLAVCVLLSLACLLGSTPLLHAARGRGSGTIPPPDPTLPTGPRLREIVPGLLPPNRVFIGATTGSWAFGTMQGTVLDREFSYVTPENDFKQSVVHRDPGHWDWSRADAWLDHIVDQNQVVRIHGPISPQCSTWAKEDQRTAAELEQMMREYFTALCRRYNGHPNIRWLDVVNETVVNGSWHKNKPGADKWELPWYKIGRDTDRHGTPLYIRYAFEIANTDAPDLKLIINQHTLDTRSWDLIKDTVAYLRERGLRVDGVGWQAHVDTGWETPENVAQLRDLIRWAHAHDLEFHVTEQSAWLRSDDPNGLAAQAETYGAIVATLLAERGHGTVAWNTWHVSDAHGWKRDRIPSLFDGTYRPKPAYYGLQGVLQAQVGLDPNTGRPPSRGRR